MKCEEDKEYRAWVFVWNNPNVTKEQFGNQLMHWKCKYIIFGLEHAPTTGTPHYQGYVYWCSAKTKNEIKRRFPGMWWEDAKGNSLQNYVYGTKEDKMDYFEFGTRPKQGARTDLNEIRVTLANGGNMRDIVDTTDSYQGIRMAEVILKYKEKPRNFKPAVLWFWGPTGAGKTRAAYELCGQDDTWITAKNLRWWEGYDGHKNVIIDDFRGDFCTFHELLRILDRYEYRIECKGGSRQLIATTMVITSCHHPRNVYETREDIEQLIRRIDKIALFKTQTETGTEVGGG